MSYIMEADALSRSVVPRALRDPRAQRSRRMPRVLALAVFSAALMSIAVPNELFKFGLAPLGFVALIPIYIAILETGGPREAALATGLFGALQHGISSFWLWFFKDFRFWTLGSTIVAYFIVYMVLGLYLWLFLNRSGKARPLAFVLLWASFEYCKSTGFLGYPWGLIPYSLTNALPLLQIADLTGVYGISAVLAAANAALAETLIGIGAGKPGSSWRPFGAAGSPACGLGSCALPPRARLAYAACAAVLLALCLGYGLARMATPIRVAGTIDAALVQQNTDPWEGREDDGLMIDIRLAREAVEKGMGGKSPDLILFSETSLLRPYAEYMQHYSKHPALDPLVPFIRETGSWLITGAPVVVDWDTGEATNSVILIDPTARLVQSYAKIHPVPFAEAIPFWDIAPFRKFIQKVVGLESGWVMGTEYVVFDLPTRSGSFRFGAPICFEDAFAGLCRKFYLKDVDLLVNLTDVSWSKTESAEIQHWAAARFRAIESRRTLVRSTNGGLTCVVGPYGEVIASLPLFEEASLRIQVPVYKDSAPTPYISLGDWFAHSALLLCAGLFVILYIDARRRSR